MYCPSSYFPFRMNGMESGFALLPSTPQQICFDKSEFMRDDYKVEQFVSDCKRRVSLEKLRDDLEQVKIFKNSIQKFRSKKSF